MFSLIIATKDRPQDLRRVLQSLSEQIPRPNEVVIVDASREPAQSVVAGFTELKTVYVRHWPPSAAAQRNVGIKACDPAATLIGFSDDDVIFEPGAMENMLAFWRQASDDVVGASFHLKNYEPTPGQSLQTSRLVDALGIYPRRPGAVALSGWHSAVGHLSETVEVEWLATTAAVWRASVLSRHYFDEFFDGYSYLEDLEFSYRVGRTHRLVAVYGPGYCHFPSCSGRHSVRSFARAEVRNRIYFVKKHGLSVWRCWVALGLRVCMTAASGIFRCNSRYLARAAFNIEELLRYPICRP